MTSIETVRLGIRPIAGFVSRKEDVFGHVQLGMPPITGLMRREKVFIQGMKHGMNWVIAFTQGIIVGIDWMIVFIRRMRTEMAREPPAIPHGGRKVGAPCYEMGGSCGYIIERRSPSNGARAGTLSINT
jgi:hypothetical protein